MPPSTRLGCQILQQEVLPPSPRPGSGAVSWALSSCISAFELDHLYTTVGEGTADTFIKVT